MMSKVTVRNYLDYFDNYKLDKASNELLNFAINTNLYLNKKEPWSLIKDKKKLNEVKIIIYDVLEATRIIGLLLEPFLPTISSKIISQLGEIDLKDKNWIEKLEWGLLPISSDLPKPKPIVNKLDYE